jgi:DNA adenine methylase
MSAPTRVLLRWHGGKWLLAPWIIEQFPPHVTYIEPFGGAASVLLRKDRSFIEIFNDLDDDLFNLFQVLQDADASGRIVRKLGLTLFSRAEFELSYETSADPIERARRFIVRSFFGFGSNACTASARGSNSTGFRARSRHPRKQPAHEWSNYPAALGQTIERLHGVVIERREAARLIVERDGPDVLFYVDPPYLPETREPGSRGRKRGGRYRHEMDTADHEALLALLLKCQGMVVLSGYASPLYCDVLTGWRLLKKKTLADAARPRTECLWINPQACAALAGVP